MQYPKVILDACIRSNIAYISPHTMKRMWASSKMILGEREGKKHPYDIGNVFRDVESEPIFINIGTGAKAYTWRKDRTLYVTFRGMHGLNIHDIKANIDIRHHRIGNHGKVQKGYWMYSNSIFQDLMNQIDSQDISTIEFTGHSMGSTLAALSAFNLSLNTRNIDIRCHVFGGPKFCDRVFSDKFMRIVPNSSHTIIKGDFVPEIYNGFEHCIQNLHIHDEKDKDLNFLEKHSCMYYIKFLQALIP